MKNTWKKVLFSLGAITFVGAGTLGIVNAQSNPLADQGGTFGDNTTIGADGTNTLNVAAGGASYKSNGLIQTLKNAVNRILGMLSFIALCICLRGGFQMLTANGDETKYKKGFTVLKQAALGLVVIGLAWLFVTLVLYLINRNAVATN